ncbi:MAG TPA: hypothetical protein K8W19_00530 [Victivallis vadensis]|nr:hypothetical protein [Victivallis vadensis]
MNQIRFAVLLGMLIGFGAIAGESRGAADLRGLGKIEALCRESGGGKSSWTTLKAGSAELAAACGSKLLADLTGFGDVKIWDGGLPGTNLKLDGTGCWLLGLDGDRVQVLFARDPEGLGALAKQANAENWKPVTPGVHPRWLDRFDNDAFAIGLLGWGKLPKDYRKGADWLGEKQFNLIGDVLNPNIQLAPGVYDFSVADWFAALAKRHGTAYHIYQPWGNPERPAWLWNRTPLPHVSAEPGFVSYPDLDYQKNAVCAAFDPVRPTDAALAASLRGIAAYNAENPDFNNHFGGVEIGHNVMLAIPTYAGDPGAVAAYAAFTGRNPEREKVEIPTMRTFAGWNPETCLDLRGEWQLKADPAGGKTPPDGDAGWSAIRSDDPLLLLYDYYSGSVWLKRNFRAADPAKLNYLHISRNAWHGRVSKVQAAFLNGKPLKDLTHDDPITGDFDECFELGGAVRAGENTIVLKLDGKPVPGYIFLGPKGRWSYPSDDPGLNRLYFDTIEFASRYRMRGIENWLKATRGGDPQGRPQLLMATWDFIDHTFDLCRKYGATAQDTGQGGACWAPWLARYYAARGLPITCEPGNAPGSAWEMRKMMTLYMLLGNEGINALFDAEQYMGNEEVRRWIDANPEVIRSAGKFEMNRPDLGVMRSVRNASRLHFPAVWSWDVSRGELQAAGRTVNLADPSDFEKDRAGAWFDVVFDAASELLTDGEIAGIERFCRNGGTFIAMHETGKHSPERGWSWPVSKLNGLRVVGRSRGGWGKLRFSKEQELWPELRGREIDAWGVVYDWTGADVTGSSLGMEPAASDVEVIAEWADRKPGEGRIAIAARKIGKGRIITLGSTFWREARDRSGRFETDPAARPYLAQLLDALKVPRSSYNNGAKGTADIFSERWRSKNGLYDLYLAAKVNDKEGVRDVALTFAAPDRPQTLREVTANGHPATPFRYEGGKLTLAGLSFEPMQLRMFAAPRRDIARAPLAWLKSLEQRWYRLPEIPADELPPPEVADGNTVSLADGWQMTVGGPVWGEAPPPDHDWKAGRTVKLGAYLTMGVPDEEAVTHFRREFTVPASWRGRRASLVFASQYWFYGIEPQGRLWVNGKPAPVEQPFGDRTNGCFMFDLTPGEKVVLELEVNGALRHKEQLRSRPSGVTGLFFLQSDPVPLKTVPVTGWRAAREVNVLSPFDGKQPGGFLYLETVFQTPSGPSRRIFLEAPDHLGWLMLNGHVISTPGWMRRLDVSNLLRRDGGENRLRWWPLLCKEKPLHNRQLSRTQPLWLAWHP